MSLYEPEPADILAFNGTGKAAGFIKWLTWSNWSHIAALAWVEKQHLESLFRRSRFLVHPSYFIDGREWSDQYQVIESTTLSKDPCNIRGLPMRGVQAHNPITRIKHYEGQVYLLRLNQDYLGDFYRSGGSAVWTEDLLSKFGASYDSFGAALSGTRWLAWLLSLRAADRSTVFCSESLRSSLQRVDLVNKGNAGLVTPGALVKELLESNVYLPPVCLKGKK